MTKPLAFSLASSRRRSRRLLRRHREQLPHPQRRPDAPLGSDPASEELDGLARVPADGDATLDAPPTLDLTPPPSADVQA